MTRPSGKRPVTLPVTLIAAVLMLGTSHAALAQGGPPAPSAQAGEASTIAALQRQIDELKAMVSVLEHVLDSRVYQSESGPVIIRLNEQPGGVRSDHDNTSVQRAKRRKPAVDTETGGLAPFRYT